MAAPPPCRGAEPPAGGRRAQQVAFDFGTARRGSQDDRALAEALAAKPGRNAWRSRSTVSWCGTRSSIPPPHTFRGFAKLGIDQRPASRGALRRIQTVSVVRRPDCPTMSAWLAGAQGRSRPRDPDRLQRRPGDHPAAELHRRSQWLVRCQRESRANRSDRPRGHRARRLAGVPRYRALPGALVQALAPETIAQGRALHRLQGWPAAIGAALLIYALGPAFGRLPSDARSSCSGAACSPSPPWRSARRRSAPVRHGHRRRRRVGLVLAVTVWPLGHRPGAAAAEHVGACQGTA